MRTIGYKKKGLLGLYIFTTIISVVVILMGISMFASYTRKIPAVILPVLLLLVMGVVILIISLRIVNTYKKTPDECIRIINEEEVEIVNNVTLNIKEITDISYRRASAKGIQYKWGDITIKTKDNAYKVRYVSECEEVSKELTKLMYISKNM